jgi:myo-inositol-1(or 4)-monophosphatase
MLKVLGELAEEVFNVRMLGSSARQLSYLADGRLDAVIEFHDMPWDFAGGVCIVEEAGGRLGSLKDGPLSYKDVGYIASNGLVHEKIKDIILKYLKNS